MAGIKFIRAYEFYGTVYTDIVYYSGRTYTFPECEMPKTARRWLNGKTGVKQFDRTFGREETIYQ